MESTLLDYFLRVAELGSINRAAADLGVSQPALSRHIAALEREMGTPLFTRTQGGVVLTDSGLLLADRARPLLRQFALLKDQVGEKASGQVALGIPPSWQALVTLPLVRRLRTDSPQVALRVHEAVSHLLREHLFAGLLDLCILPFAAAVTAGHRQTPLLREPLVLVGPRDAGLLPSVPTPVEGLQPLKLVLPGRLNLLRTLVEHALQRKGLAVDLAAETDGLGLCLGLAGDGVGFTVVPACAVQQGEPRDVSWSPVRGLYITWALWENTARGHSQAVQHGRRAVLQTVAERLADGTWHGAEPVSEPQPA